MTDAPAPTEPAHERQQPRAPSDPLTRKRAPAAFPAPPTGRPARAPGMSLAPAARQAAGPGAPAPIDPALEHARRAAREAIERLGRSAARELQLLDRIRVLEAALDERDPDILREMRARAALATTQEKTDD